MAIKDPTDVIFRRQGGSNLLIVGQQDELAFGILANCLLSLSAQLAPHGHQPDRFHSFYVLDGTRPDSPDAGFWQRLVKQVPFDAKIVPPRDAAQTVGKLAEEVERRLASGDQTAEPIFLCINNLARFRELKKSDDFGVSSFEETETSNADKQLTTLLREGPSLGVHTLIWCDSYANLNRWLERSTMRDLEMRVLFQMSATDSSNLMDSPAASRLGVHMAIYYNEEKGQAEKFRPYGMPSPTWLAWVAEQLTRRVAVIEKS